MRSAPPWRQLAQQDRVGERDRRSRRRRRRVKAIESVIPSRSRPSDGGEKISRERRGGHADHLELAAVVGGDDQPTATANADQAERADVAGHPEELGEPDARERRSSRSRTARRRRDDGDDEHDPGDRPERPGRAVSDRGPRALARRRRPASLPGAAPAPEAPARGPRGLGSALAAARSGSKSISVGVPTRARAAPRRDPSRGPSPAIARRIAAGAPRAHRDASNASRSKSGQSSSRKTSSE